MSGAGAARRAPDVHVVPNRLKALGAAHKLRKLAELAIAGDPEAERAVFRAEQIDRAANALTRLRAAANQVAPDHQRVIRRDDPLVTPGLAELRFAEEQAAETLRLLEGFD